MIKILSAEQIKEADAATIKNEPVASIDLMERAAKQCAAWISDSVSAGKAFAVFCGKGNNGGDGLAIARMLFETGKNISVYIFEGDGKESADYKINLDRLKKIAAENIFTIKDSSEFPALDTDAIIIDAIFGSGINRKPHGIISSVIQSINKLQNTVIAIDLPSGLFADQHTADLTNVVNANFTLTFEAPKRSFFHNEYAIATGKWIIIDLNLDKTSIQNASSKVYFIEERDAIEILKPRPEFGHKGTFGHALLLAGSQGKTGAAILAVKSCLRSGAGLVTARVPQCVVLPLQTTAPEAMLIPDEGNDFLNTPVKIENHSAIGVGPGIGMEKQTANVLKHLIQDSAVPLVIDADALNILADNPTWFSFLPAGSVLTPHPGEFKRLFGNIANPFDRNNVQLEFARKNNCYVLLKGKFSALACPDGSLLFNCTGNSGMAKGGSGDVLTGLITGFIAQGYSSFQSALLGMYLHGLAGDLAAEELTENAMIAGDLIDFFPSAFKTLGLSLGSICGRC